MLKKWYQGNRVSFLKASWVILIQLIVILSVELYFNLNQPNETNTEKLIHQSLEKAQSNFNETKLNLASSIQLLSSELKELSLEQLKNYPLPNSSIKFVLTHFQSIINWNNQVPYIPKKYINSASDFEIITIGFSDYLKFNKQISEEINLIGLVLIRSNPISTSKNQLKLYSILSEWITDLDFPVQFRLQYDSTNTPGNQIALTNSSEKPLAYLSAYPDSISLLNYQWNSFKNRVRSIYTLLFVIISLGFFVFTSKNWDLEYRLAFRLIVILIFWILITNSELEYHLTDFIIQFGIRLNRALSIVLIRLNLHALFFSYLSLELIRGLRIQKRFFAITWYPRTVILSTLSGILSYFALTSIPASFYHLVSIDSIELLDSNLFPPVETLFFILGLGASFSFGFLLVLFGNSFLLNSEQDQQSWVYPFVFLGFTISHGIISFLEIGYATEIDPFLLVLALFSLILYLSSYNQKHPNSLRNFSIIRQILMGSFLVTLFLYPTLHLRYKSVREKELYERAYSLVNDFLDYRSFNSNKGSIKVFKHDQGIWPGAIYIAAYDSTLHIQASWNRSLIPFSEISYLSFDAERIKQVENGINFKKTISYGGQTFTDAYLYAPNSKLIIRGIIPIIPFQSHVFSFFRFFYCILFLFIVLIVVRITFSSNILFFFDGRENLQSRILDTYLIASLLFLVALIGTTGFIVSNEDTELQMQTLRDKTEQIITSISEDSYGSIDRPFIRFLADRFEVSIDVYQNQIWSMGASFQNISVTENTNLLEHSIFSRLVHNHEMKIENWYAFGNERIGSTYFKVNAGPYQSSTMKISLRSTVSGNNEQLLRSVSYLIAVYVFIFSLFIILAYFTSRYLAAPLQRLLQGLRRISSGRLDTIVPVTTQDEIGELANAYNFMIFRLKDLQKELAEVERQAAWSEMARQVAHEIKNPLTPMKLTLQHLLRLVLLNDGDNTSLKADFERISKGLIQQIDSLSTIASDFSKFARPITDEMDVLNVNQLLNDIDELYQHDQHIKIILDLSEKNLLIFGVAEDLKRVFINLVKNSIESMPNGGIIFLRTYPYKNEVFIEVVDTGAGIPVNLQKNVFKPNFSTKTSGTGIGLAICKKVVEAHKGQIQFASVPGSGTTFTLSFTKVDQE